MCAARFARSRRTRLQVDEDRFGDHRHSFYTPAWTPLPFEVNCPRLRQDPPRPDALPEMLEASRRLAEDFCFMRVDDYVIERRLHVGELTDIPQNGNTIYMPDSADGAVGRLFLEGADIEDVLRDLTVERGPAAGGPALQ
jgi:hypothetical protein